MKIIDQELTALSGNEAVAYAFKQARPHVASAFPITPQTEMMHKFADFVANGQAQAEMILVESEHSAMSAAIGSAAAGARTITATSSGIMSQALLPTMWAPMISPNSGSTTSLTIPSRSR